MRTYLYLYLFSPVINKYLNGISKINRIYLLLILAFMAIYISTLSYKDLSVWSGKNLVNFMLMYVIGDCLKSSKEYWMKLKSLPLIFLYVVLNVALVLLYLLCKENFIGRMIWMFSYSYYGVLSYINAILFFIIVGKLSIKSKCVNYCAGSVLAIYLIHCSPALQGFRSDVALFLYSECGSDILFLFVNVVYVLGIMALCIFADKAFTPLWIGVEKLGTHLNKRYGYLFNML